MCSLETRCNECTDWSVEVMTEYLKHRKSLATKRGKKPAFAAASASSQPAVASSPLLGSPPRFPSLVMIVKLGMLFYLFYNHCHSQVV